MYKLIIEDDEGKTTVVPLIRDEITIGRKEGNTIRLTERNVSRRHAKLYKSNGAVIIEDLQSYNGIKVNGDRIGGRATIAEGDRIQIGDYQLALKIERQATDEPRDDKTTPFIREGEGATASMQMPAQVAAITKPPKVEDKPAHLVIVSSNFAGQEFKLDKPTMVIGRTDDNDIVINHRSISRHHAQILREGSHYHIVDMQSANGVRVNGEDYGKVELRKGDHIDLGHVRMRFVGPGEDFIFARDADVIDVARTGGGGKSKTGMIIGVGLGMVVLAAGVFVALKLTGGDKGKGDVEGQVAKLALEADKAANNLDWDTAIAKCDDGIKLSPTEETLRTKKVKFETEKKNEDRYNRYQKAVKEENYDAAVALYQEIGETSVYHEKAGSTFVPVKKAYVKDHVAKARALGSKCDEVKRHVEQVLIVDEGNQEALEIARKCGQTPPKPKTTTASTQPGLPRLPKEGPESPTTTEKPATPTEKPATTTEKPATTTEKPATTTEKPAGGDAGDAEKLLADANDDYIHGNYASALEKARKANKGGSNPKAWRLIGACSCYLNDVTTVRQAWNRLDAQGRYFVQYVCKRNNISVP